MAIEEMKRRDQFPVGMRVLAVDDDPTCLKLLEALLLRCQYNVTTTGQAITALRILRENKDKFDLVISDVHMPDMDGFKLLELVGLEMDLPVIMLSANSDTKAVMKGITHGACDYLLKPVRFEELKNIWQHVVRRRKIDTKDSYNYDNEESEKHQFGSSEAGQSAAVGGGIDRCGRPNKKRKDHNDEDENDCPENLLDDDDPSTQKKPRVVWSIELHRKFVSAVNQLGIEKAVPKRILDLMNVEGLTRENVASHLQKYRLYLKRLSAVASQQANIVAALRARDPSYTPISAVNGFGSYNALTGSGRIPSFPSFQPNGATGQMNSPGGYGWQRLAASGMIQFGHTQNITNNPLDDQVKPLGIQPPAYQHPNLLQGLPVLLEPEQFQQQKTALSPNAALNNGASSSGAAIGNSTNSFANLTNNPLSLQPNQLHSPPGGLSNRTLLGAASLTSHPFEMGLGDPPTLPDLRRCDNPLESAVPLANCSSNPLSVTVPVGQGHLSSTRVVDTSSAMFPHLNVGLSKPSSITECFSAVLSHVNGNLSMVPSNNAAVASLQIPVRGTQQQTTSPYRSTILTPTSVAGDSEFLDFRNTLDSAQGWCKQKMDNTCSADFLLASSLNDTLSNHGIDGPNAAYNEKMLKAGIGETNLGALAQPCKVGTSTGDSQLKLHNSFSPSSSCSLDDIVNAMIKPEHDDAIFLDGDIGCDIYSLGTCM